ncbi:MAG: acetate/propionate family kinase [Planctomycetes bacterium]|nr:acetate/propionate family kinase [Planctomycetota bacterium]
MRGVVPITDAVVAEIDKLIPSAPLHLPQVLATIAEVAAIWPKVPLFLVSDTAFFADLPAREYTYGLDPTLAARFGERRTGYHGLFHEAACRFMRRTLRSPEPGRIISICLEPKPEAAAVLNGRPVMVTSGATPIEGLPGETMCGDIDPSIVLILAEKLDYGPEHINDILTQESGLRGLVGRKVKLGDVLNHNKPAYRQAREVFSYRLLLACGAAVAAMSGVDALVFSGRYAEAARNIAPWLISRLHRAASYGKPKPEWHLFTEPVEKIAAEMAAVAYLAWSMGKNRREPCGQT